MAETAQAFSTHHVSVLVGYGAHAVCPYLAFESCRQWRTTSRTEALIKQGGGGGFACVGSVVCSGVYTAFVGVSLSTKREVAVAVMPRPWPREFLSGLWQRLGCRDAKQALSTLWLLSTCGAPRTANSF